MFNSFLQLLNDNQGLLAAISIAISVIGFFITNKNINTQSQTVLEGDKASLETVGRDMNKRILQKQKTGNYSLAQQAGRDINVD